MGARKYGVLEAGKPRVKYSCMICLEQEFFEKVTHNLSMLFSDTNR